MDDLLPAEVNGLGLREERPYFDGVAIGVEGYIGYLRDEVVVVGVVDKAVGVAEKVAER